MIDLDKHVLACIKQILETHIPNTKVLAFGSRVTGHAKLHSDLDLAIVADKAIPTETMNQLRFAFSDSDLPIMVDLVDWHTLSDTFRDNVQQNCHPLV